ncbi:MAG: hypothetical protein U1A72_11640, partial [Sulfuritalea sp.]|nr:hypothetical protein [Sulfuritalea sp.]
VAELSKLTQQARISGVDMGTVEMALVRLSKGMHGTKEESEKATRALEALGLKAADLKNMDTAKQLQIVAGAMNKFGDSSGKTALAMDLLGKSGAKVLPFLKDMANDGELAATVTAEQAAKAEELEKAVRRLGNEFSNFKQAVMIDAVPALLEWVEANAKAIKIAGSATEALWLFAFNLDAMTTEAPRQEIDRLTESLRKFQEAGPIGKFMQSPTGALFGGREADLKKQIEFLKYLEAQAALKGRTGPQFLDARDLALQQKATLNYKELKKATEDTDSAYRGLLKTLKEKLLIDKDLTEVNKLQLALDAMSVKARATITPEREKELKALAAQVDLNKQAKKAFDERAKAEEAFNALGKKNKEFLDSLDTKNTEAIIAAGKTIENIKAEARELALTNEAREQAIALRALEASGIDKTNEAYGRLAAQLTIAVAEKILAEKNKKAADEITEFWKSAAQSMQQSMSGFFFDVMQGNLSDLSGSFKRSIDRMVADVLAAKAATALFGADFGKGGGIGGLVGKGLDWLTGSAGVAGIDAMAMPVLATGTPFVSRDGPAFLHRGEAVIPAAENNGGGGGMTVINQFTITGAMDRRTQAQIAAAAGESVQRAMARNT